jgi:hypothetical protein
MTQSDLITQFVIPAKAGIHFSATGFQVLLDCRTSSRLTEPRPAVDPGLRGDDD